MKDMFTANNQSSKDINDPQSDYKTIITDNFMQFVFDQGADVVELEIKIVGDMSYIETKDFRKMGFDLTDKHYLSDGSFDTDKEWHVHVNITNPEDLNAETGLMKGFNKTSDNKRDVRVPIIKGFYKVIEITSKFNNGDFTQELRCVRERNQKSNILKEIEQQDKSRQTEKVTEGGKIIEVPIPTVQNNEQDNPTIDIDDESQG